jgi:hypothetical protein
VQINLREREREREREEGLSVQTCSSPKAIGKEQKGIGLFWGAEEFGASVN